MGPAWYNNYVEYVIYIDQYQGNHVQIGDISLVTVYMCIIWTLILHGNIIIYSGCSISILHGSAQSHACMHERVRCAVCMSLHVQQYTGL